jgi:arylsulfatase A-like enzyme
VDVLPTLLEACGMDVPERIQGRSFLPLLTGDEYELNEAVYAEKTFHDCYDPMRCIRTRRYKYIRYFEKSALHRVPGDIIFRGASLELGRLGRDAEEELFDLAADPDEKHNLAGDPELAERVKDLRGRLLDWMKRTNDPLLDGPVASPFYYRALREMREA